MSKKKSKKYYTFMVLAGFDQPYFIYSREVGKLNKAEKFSVKQINKH